MNASDDIRKKFERAAGRAASQADAELRGQLDVLLKATKTDLESLKPKVTDRATYEKLIAVVGEATQSNMDLAEVVSRVKALGGGALGLVKEVAGRLRPV